MREPTASDEVFADELIATPKSSDERAVLYTREFWLVFCAHFALNAEANLFVLFPLFVVDLGANAQTLGAVVGTFSLAALIARVGIGSAVDIGGRRALALRFLTFDIVAMALYIPLRSLGWPLFAVRALHGATEGVARVALFAMVYEILPAGRRGEGMATFSLCGMMPGAAAPLLGEVIIKRLGFTAFFVTALALCALAVFATSRLPADRPRAVTTGAHTTASRYGALMRDRSLAPLWIVTLLFSLGISSRLSFVAPYAYQKGVGMVAWYFMIYSGVAIVLRLFGARVMDRVGLERVLAPSLVVLAVGLVLLALTGRPWMLEAAALVGGVGHGYAYPSLSALVIGRTQADAMGSSSTIYTSLYDIGAMAGPYVLGVIATLFGYQPMFTVAGLIVLCGAIYFMAVEPRLFASRLA